MARYSATNPTAKSITNGVTKHLVQLTNNSADTPIVVEEVHFEGFGTSSTAAKAIIEVCRIDDGDEGTVTAIRAKKHNLNDPASNCAAGVVTDGSEGTVIDLGGGEVDCVWRRSLHLQGGITYRFPGDGIPVPPGCSLVQRVITGGNGSTFMGGFTWREGA
jgi:hypothetical protein